MSSYETLLLDINGPIATITLNRPDKHNAFNATLISELTTVAINVAQNKTVRAVIFAANGKNFCAGADLNWMKETANASPEKNRDEALALTKLLSALSAIPQPTIAKIQGKVFGGGIGIIACCDFSFCAADSQFCLSEVKLGLSAATISPYLLRAMGYTNALRCLLSAELMDAEQAKLSGLIYRVCPANQLDSTVSAFALTLSKNGPYAMQTTKELMQLLSPIDDKVLITTAEMLAKVRSGAEAKEGMQAFFEKRSAKWSE